MEQHPTSDHRMPRQIVWAVLAITALPFVLNLAGVDFGTARTTPPGPDGATGIALVDTMHASLRGSFTHTLLEWTAFCAALFTAALAFLHFGTQKDGTTPIIGMALFCAGAVDAFHTLAADRLIEAVASNQDLIPFTWAIGRLFNALILAVGVALLLWRRPRTARIGLGFVFTASLGFGAVAYTIIRACAMTSRLPQTMYPEAFITRPWDVAPLLLFLVLGVWLCPLLHRQVPSVFSHALIISMVPQVVAQLHMAFGSTALHDNHFNVSHFMKIIAYLVPMAGLTLEQFHTYRAGQSMVERLLAARAGLNDRTLQLEDTNLRLTAEIEEREAAEEELQRYTAEIEESRDRIQTQAEQLATNAEDLAKNRTALLAEVEERRRADVELRAASEAARAGARSKGEFLATMSHEIRTPMNGVLGMLSLLSDTNLDDEQRECCNVTHSSAELMLSVLNDILDYSKIEAGKMQIESVSFDLQHVVEETVRLHAPQADEKGLDLIVRYVPGTPRYFLGDPGRLRQVLMNLVGNALKFTTSGHVLVSVECEKRIDGKACLRLAVEDTGIGIPPDKAKTIFETFTQADASTTRQFGGTGLGLAICHRLLDLMGGTIQATNRKCGGATFEVQLSLSVDENRSVGDGGDERLDGVRILLVVEHGLNRQILCEQMMSLGLRADTCGTAIEALSLLRAARQGRDPYRGVMFESNLTGMGGIKMARTIRSEAAPGHPLLLALVPGGGKRDRQDLDAAGVDSLLTRPVLPSQLHRALTRWLGDPAWKPARNSKSARGRQDTVEGTCTPVFDLRVLLAEDNPVNQKVARKMLSRLGCRVDTTSNGREAVLALRNVRYDMIFMDCPVPGNAAWRPA